MTLLGTFWVSNICPQCYLNPSTTTAPQDEIYRTDVLDLKEMTLSILDFISIIKKEFWSGYGQNLTLTSPFDGSCAILGNGQSLQDFTRKNRPVLHLSSIPILTDVVQLSSNKFYIPSQSRSILLNKTQFESLTTQLHITLALKENGPPQLSIFKDENSDSLILESFDVRKSNACSMSHLGKNILHSFENTLQIVEKIWKKMRTILRFYGAEDIIQSLETCLSIDNLALENLLNSPSSSFDFCLQSISNTTAIRKARQANLLSFLLGEGKQLSEIENSLKDSILHFNSNFRKMDIFDAQVIDSFHNLERDIQSLVSVEIDLQNQLSELSRHTRLHNLRLEYALTKMQHEIALHRVLVESQLDDNIILLQRALFGSNVCNIDLCESGISHEVFGTEIKVHREIISLQPIRKYLISCQAKDEVLVPKIHNNLAELTISGSFLVENQLYSSQNLQNATHVNAVVHPLPESEKLLTVFHHFSNYSSFFIQCLKPASFTLNSKMVQCQRLEYFSLPENFEIVFEGKTLKSQRLIEEKHKIKVSWMQDFVFSNIDQKPLSVNPPLTMLHPTVEKFIFDEAGEIRVNHVSYAGSVVFLLIFIFCSCCCWKSVSFREFFIAKTKMGVNMVYRMFTTENYRLAKEAKHLDKQLDKSWKELKRLEGVLEKKSELKRKLPTTDEGRAPPTAKVPSAPTVDKTPSAPPLDQHTVSCEVHATPKSSNSSRTPFARYSRTPSTSALEKN